MYRVFGTSSSGNCHKVRLALEHLRLPYAILCYLADGTPLWPSERRARAETLQWLFWEQYSHEPYVAVARFIRCYLPPDTPRVADLPKCLERGYQALAVMEQHLARRPFMVDDRYTIADISLFAYTHVAQSGGFDMSRFPAIGEWIARVREQPGYVAMAPPPRGG